MKEIVVLRHGEKEGDTLTPEGIQACQTLAERIGPFSTVISSETNRAAETAELLSGNSARRDTRANVPIFPEDARGNLTRIQAEHPLGIVGGIWQDERLIDCARQAGQRLLGLVEETLKSLPEDGRGLIVSHDGTMVPLEKLLTHESFDSVDHSFGSLEGIVIDEHLGVRSFEL